MSGESGKKEDKYEHCYQLSAKCSSQDKQRWENNETKVERWTNVEVVVVGLALTTILQTFTFLWNFFKKILMEIKNFLTGDFSLKYFCLL